MVAAAMKLKDPCSMKEDKRRQHIQKQRHHFADKGPNSQSHSVSSSCMDVRVGPKRRLRAEELMLLNCYAG